jgi:lipoprotein-anchoring transpeptidase ErfK/SrfK
MLKKVLILVIKGKLTNFFMNFQNFYSFFKAGIIILLSASIFTSCGTAPTLDKSNKMIISVKDQRMILTKNGIPVKSYRVSTSKFGLGNDRNSCKTPLGNMEIAQKIGCGAKSGTVFKSRRKTGEILKPNAPGRDPIVTRIIWLKGKEHRNSNTFGRYIYIHGTPEEFNIGKPVSYGCIRMKSSDIIDLYQRVGVGAQVSIINTPLYKTNEGRKSANVFLQSIFEGA